MTFSLNGETFGIDVDARDCSRGCACIGVYTLTSDSPNPDPLCPACGEPLVGCMNDGEIEMRFESTGAACVQCVCCGHEIEVRS